MQERLPMWLFIYGAALGACAALQTEPEELVYRWADYVKERWKVVSMQKSTQGSKTEWIREVDDAKNWRELVILEIGDKSWGGRSPKEVLSGMQATRQKECPSLTDWSLIQEDGGSVLYEWQSQPCKGWPALYQIVKILDGKHKRFRLAYTATAEYLSPERRAKWIKTIAESKAVLGTSQR